MAPQERYPYTAMKRRDPDGHEEMFPKLTTTLASVDIATSPTIAEFYRGRNLFVTGGSGLMGKVLLEKLLRSCPDIGTIYLLMREKKGVHQADRLKSMLEIPLFDRLRSEQPNALNKLVMISGDVEQIGLGISDQDVYILKNEVSVVFHTAASVRFDDPIKKAILLNSRGTREIIRIAEEMRQLKVFVHVSTTYCNAENSVIEEKVYKPRADWQKMIDMAETVDPKILHVLEAKIIRPLPNTYTFSKSLGEDIIHEAANHLPVIIYRPSIVVASNKEPVPGWLDNLNGPMGLIVGAGTGVIHSIHGNTAAIADWIPVDVAINGMISASWYRGVCALKTEKTLVINAATSAYRPLPYSAFTGIGQEITREIPYNKLLWYPFVFMTMQYPLYYILVILFHVIPAMLIDLLSPFTSNKIRLVRLYRKIFVANAAVSLFMNRGWTIKTNNFNSLQNIMSAEDRDKFSVNYLPIDPVLLMRDTILGVKKYILNEDPDIEKTLPGARANLQRYQIFHWTVISGWIIVLSYFTYALFL